MESTGKQRRAWFIQRCNNVDSSNLPGVLGRRPTFLIEEGRYGNYRVRNLTDTGFRDRLKLLHDQRRDGFWCPGLLTNLDLVRFTDPPFHALHNLPRIHVSVAECIFADDNVVTIKKHNRRYHRALVFRVQHHPRIPVRVNVSQRRVCCAEVDTDGSVLTLHRCSSNATSCSGFVVVPWKVHGRRTVGAITRKTSVKSKRQR